MKKSPYKDIYTVLKFNRLVVISVVIMAFLVCLWSIFQVVKLNREIRNTSFAVNTDGSVIPLKLVAQKENLSVEARSHLELFHSYFYGLTPTNYEAQLEKALWLGHTSVTELYKQRLQEGYYNRLLQYSLIQEIEVTSSRVDLTKGEPYPFEVISEVKLNRGGGVMDRYTLRTTGHLIHVDRNYPWNTHGLLITDFFESDLKKIEE